MERPANKDDLQETSSVEPSYRVTGKMAIVQANKLNVRSGPGLNFPVVQQVRRHQALTIREKKEGLFVLEPAGSINTTASRSLTGNCIICAEINPHQRSAMGSPLHS